MLNTDICCFTMKIKGEKGAVEKMVSWLQADYRYLQRYDGDMESFHEGAKPDEMVFKIGDHFVLYTNAEHHFDQIFSFGGRYLADETDGSCTYIGHGDCAVSCYDCMFGPSPYLSAHDIPSGHMITLPEACEILHVNAELYSYEAGCGIAEHFLVDSGGNVVVEKTHDYKELWFDDKCSTREEAEEFIGRQLTDEEWSNGYVVICGVNPQNPDWII